MWFGEHYEDWFLKLRARSVCLWFKYQVSGEDWSRLFTPSRNQPKRCSAIFLEIFSSNSFSRKNIFSWNLFSAIFARKIHFAFAFKHRASSLSPWRPENCQASIFTLKMSIKTFPSPFSVWLTTFYSGWLSKMIWNLTKEKLRKTCQTPRYRFK